MGRRRAKFELVEGHVPAPMPPPHDAIPKLPQRLPVLSNEWTELRAILTGALSVDLGDADMKILCYLMRRAHGMGLAEGRARA